MIDETIFTDPFTAIIYCVEQISTKRKYVGRTTKTLEKRKKQHYRDSKNPKDTCKFHKALRDFPPEDFKWFVVENVSLDDIKTKEQFYLNLLFLEQGAEMLNSSLNAWGGGGEHTSKTCAKISAAKKGKSPSIQTRTKMSVAKKGIPHSPQTRAKQSAAHKGKPRSLKIRAKISTAMKGQIPWNKGKSSSSQTRAKQSAAKKGKISGNKGKSHTPESKQKISVAISKPVVQIDKKTGVIIKIWQSAAQAATDLVGIDASSISKCCLGKLKSAGGFCWEFYK